MDEQIKEQIRGLIREEMSEFLREDSFTFQKHVQMFNGRNIQTGKGTGTKIGTATDQKVGFYGVPPVVQGATINDPSGGGTQDAEARTAINALIDRLQAIGIIA